MGNTKKRNKERKHVIWDAFIVSQESSSENLRLQRRESISLGLIRVVVCALTQRMVFMISIYDTANSNFQKQILLLML